MKFTIVIFVSLLTNSILAQVAPTGTVNVPIEEYDRLRMQSGQGGVGAGLGCLSGMINQVSQGMTSKFEQQQQEANSLVGIADKYFQLGKECRNDLGKGLIEFEQKKLEVQLENNKLNTRMKRQEIAYKQALLGVKRQCDATANTQFAQTKASAGDPNRVITAKDGGLKALTGRNKRINRFRKIFYESCMADPLNIEAMRLTGLELAANVQEIQDNLKSVNDSMASVTKQIEFSQDLTLKNCAEGEKQLEYQEAVIRSTNKQAAAMVKKQNMFGLLGAGMSCIFGPNSVVPGFAPDATGNPMPVTN